ncbi:MAG: ATP-dependent helicase [Deltaproteobacteria bacterium]|nr:ATP-dependent helicase [Deltaproteobacteria bacterium]
MLFRTHEDTYQAYQRFAEKGNFKKAYHCLESLLSQFPRDVQLITEIVNFSLFEWGKYEMARPWLITLTKIRSFWADYALLSRGEADLGNNRQARKYLEQAKELLPKQPSAEDKRKARETFAYIESRLEYNDSIKTTKKKETGGPATGREQPPASQQARASRKADIQEPAVTKPVSQTPSAQIKQEGTTPGRERESSLIPAFNVPLTIAPPDPATSLINLPANLSSLKEIKLRMEYTHLTIQGGFDELLCLNSIRGVEKFWYQIETVKKVLKYFRGRVLLCDEVGLGKTIEAGMVIKEYLLRGMARNILILTPPALVSQWQEEMQVKFGLEFATTDDPEAMEDPERFWKGRYIIASLHTAKSKRNMPLVTREFFDLLVVDEAHHLRNRSTLAWKLVNQFQKRYILLLSATPLQNNLIELFNLITLLKPGQFKTEKLFRQEYLARGNLRTPANKDKLRELLREVMIRNTRSAIDLKLPRRYATTLRIEPTEVERKIYQGLNDYLRGNGLNRQTVTLLLREAGSSPAALRGTLARLPPNRYQQEIMDRIGALEDSSKGKALLDILRRNVSEKVVIFTQFIKSVDYLTDLLRRNGISFATFKGTLSNWEKNAAIENFRNEAPVLISTESGGEGRNLQFCNTMVNFDLPWNPMRIEQRIGRLHRIGQTRDVFIFNLSLKETIEDHMMDILDHKINMFEMVIGEIEPILGHLETEEDFENIILEIWLRSQNERDLAAGFARFGDELLKAKKAYVQAKAFDEDIFGEDYEI